MTNRSSHIPVRTETDAITEPVMVRVFLNARIPMGMKKQQSTHRPKIGCEGARETTVEDRHLRVLVAVPCGQVLGKVK